MNYPFWDVPIIGSTWVIGGIAIFHVLVSHFAIGGGFYLPMAEAKALREGRDDWMEVIRGHAKFFLVLTSVFGAVTGVAIWFAIGLANPEGTSTLIHNFVFGWAIEWTFFIVEIAAAMVYYYTWGKVDPKTHLRVGWVYAITAWLSLVIINGILTFMLTPGETWLSVAGTGNEASKFWNAFFNPTYWPSLVLRTLICISLAGIWAFVTASRIDAKRNGALKAEVMRWSARWLLPAYLIIPIAFFWYLSQIPAARLQLLQRRACRTRDPRGDRTGRSAPVPRAIEPPKRIDDRRRCRSSPATSSGRSARGTRDIRRGAARPCIAPRLRCAPASPAGA